MVYVFPTENLNKLGRKTEKIPFLEPKRILAADQDKNENENGSPAGSGVTEVEFHGEAVREEIQETEGEPEAEE